MCCNACVCFDSSTAPTVTPTPTVGELRYNGRCVLDQPVTLVIEERLRGHSVVRFAKVSRSHG